MLLRERVVALDEYEAELVLGRPVFCSTAGELDGVLVVLRAEGGAIGPAAHRCSGTPASDRVRIPVNSALENVAVWPGTVGQVETLHRGRLRDVGLAMQVLSVTPPGGCGPIWPAGDLSLDQCGCEDRLGQVEPTQSASRAIAIPLSGAMSSACSRRARVVAGSRWVAVRCEAALAQTSTRRFLRSEAILLRGAGRASRADPVDCLDWTDVCDLVL